MTSSDPHDANYPVFRECLSSAIVEKSDTHRPAKTKRKAHKPGPRRNGKVKKDDVRAAPEPTESESSALRGDPEELADFIDFLASEIFTSFPPDLQTLDYTSIQHSAALRDRYTSNPLPPATLDAILTTLPPSVPDTLTVYGLLPAPGDASDVSDFLGRVVTEYAGAVTRAPPVWATTRTEGCEICERDWIPLSYHHLIPRGVHEKVRKKGWHEEWMLNSVAWLCRACHSFVHRMASNEELAREWFTVDRILEREDVRDWAKWVSRVRWKAR
ncbi:hypothetical protein P170DRAFT_428141 [Aspergillus steynii IBT 23096]|uniref:HNH domain-containing protein n=1 Tax=Aspergillus steynii IBT 23096 TaxID=1392250 RepID=A0A2I2G1W7_9EURO|nr:uncharacterized protein P170DRAFT_428141 [Aspergillus steynii IBT 23096]PLB46873.1 hypothetical protein P170DRAFT_428141 [Aspergillus steynii IBT 23096]